jgi:cell division protein FtsN
MKNQQRGGTILGLIFGMVIGLAAALAVAVYVTKVPVPFLNKGGNNTSAMRLRPSATRTGTPTRRPEPPACTAPGDTSSSSERRDGVAAHAAYNLQPAESPRRRHPTPEKPAKPASGDPLGDLVKEPAAADKAEKSRADKEKAAAQTASSSDSAFNYFVQAGAFRGQSEAEAQRAKLAMLGWEPA